MGGEGSLTRSVRVLVIDDDASSAEMLSSGVSMLPATCEIARSVSEGVRALARESFDVLITDVRMPGMNGFELFESVRKGDPTLPVIFVTANGVVQEAAQAARQGVFDYLVKPVDPNALCRTIRRAVIEREDRDGPRSSGPLSLASVSTPSPLPPPPLRATPARVLLGHAASIVELLSAIDRVAHSTAPVLVIGETGAGKDVVAQRIHEQGLRRHRPFVSVNTTAIPSTLLESELFGHVKGAFTGATQARRGLLVEADGGTLFLDEIGDMPLELQGTLLRVIETGEVRSVGSDRGRRVDVRFVAATHRDLPALVQKGLFREDLYYRLNILSLTVPPLRERRSDIGLLADHFLEQARTRMPSSQVHAIAPDAKEVLRRAAWPGNVRQLAAVIERIVVLGRGSRIEVSDLRHLEEERPASEDGWPGEPFELCSLKALTDRYVNWVLGQAGNDKARAAAILGVDISTLYRWQRRAPSGPSAMSGGQATESQRRARRA